MDILHRKRAPKALIGLSLASFLVAGCAYGPFSNLSATNPWIRRQWQEDEEYKIPTFHKRIAEMKSVREGAARLSPPDKERLTQQLMDIAQNDPNPLIRAAAVQTIGKLPSQSVFPILQMAVQDENEQVRMAACQAWGEIGGSEALETLAEVARREEDIDVRVVAAKELGRFNDPEAVSALGLVLNDSDPALQYVAVESLKASTGHDFGDSVPAWRDFVAGRTPAPAESPSVVERLRRLF